MVRQGTRGRFRRAMVKRRCRSTGVLCALIIPTLSCAGSGSEEQPTEDLPGPAAGTVHEYAYLEKEVQRLLAFLRAHGPLPEDVLADSVTLYVAPEGGGEVRKVADRDLRSRAEWRVGSYSLVPPSGFEHSRVTPGLHSYCEAVTLDTRYPELAQYPHVGVRLARDEAASCMQTWNVTFVFDEDADAPRLIAVVYDQWEW